ncbi:MAG: hypothetical protein IT269_01235 [Saprospiraceae bacterium]|nr:hypothetical protein [Saprospiraceae bacterium]
MNHHKIYFVFAGLALSMLFAFTTPTPNHTPNWGFFAHKRINRLAVMTLPPEMMAFFKPNIDYLTDHAVDPDMRRYAARNEGSRHYIDLDQYGAAPFDDLPRTWLDALLLHTDIWVTTAAGEKFCAYGPGADSLRKVAPDSVYAWRRFFTRQISNRLLRNEEDTALPADSVALLLFNRKNNTGASAIVAASFEERLMEHGILPWHLQVMQRRITEAFKRGDGRQVLRLCADMGHYIGDAHVPLHTTSNYNGQKTSQHGIHGFWESRIPELFADDDYDYFVGKPEYVDQTRDWFWGMVLQSNTMVDSVLLYERKLSKSYPSDRQMCPDMRLGVMLVAPCRDYAAAYQDALNGMIERRMRAAIHAVSSAWYTAWVDAGQPDLKKMQINPPSADEIEEEKEMKKAFEKGKIKGREETH